MQAVHITSVGAWFGRCSRQEAEIAERVPQAPGLVEQGAAYVRGVPVTGIEFACVLKSQQRLVAPSLLLQHRSQTEEKFRPDILLQRPREPLHGVIVLAGVERQQSHQMQAVGVAGIGCERLLAAELRVERPPGAPMVEAGLVERSRRVSVPTARLGAGILGGAGPTFPAIYQRVPCLAAISAVSALRTRSSTLA